MWVRLIPYPHFIFKELNYLFFLYLYSLKLQRMSPNNAPPSKETISKKSDLNDNTSDNPVPFAIGITNMFMHDKKIPYSSTPEKKDVSASPFSSGNSPFSRFRIFHNSPFFKIQ